MIYNYKGLMKKTFSYIYRASINGKNLGYISKGLKKIVGDYEQLNAREKNALYIECYNLARKCKRTESGDAKEVSAVLTKRVNYDKVLSTMKKVNRNNQRRNNVSNTKDMLKDTDNIFFICSKHNNPAVDHKDLQGKIYVDRFWRTKCSGKVYRAVSDYIKANNIMTVQEVMQGPYWLITRPNCKHRLIPLEVSAVLDASLSDLAKEYTVRENLVQPKDYYELKTQVYEKLHGIAPTPVLEENIQKNKRRLI